MRLVLLALILNGTVFASEPLVPRGAGGFQQTVEPFFERHCFECHDEDTQKGDLDLTPLTHHMSSREETDVWLHALD
ncbi:MAG: c-type cytochrome domain-containing protein, partial [Verrucomicrobiota bacterium]